MKDYKKKILKYALLIIGSCIYVICIHLVGNGNRPYIIGVFLGLILACCAALSFK